jgi:hypothetical protein
MGQKEQNPAEQALPAEDPDSLRSGPQKPDKEGPLSHS